MEDLKKAATRSDKTKKRNMESHITPDRINALMVIAITIVCSVVCPDIPSFTVLLLVVAVLFGALSVKQAKQLIRK